MKYSRQDYIEGRVTHDEYYRQFAKDHHIALVGNLGIFGIRDLAHLQSLLERDPNLNNIPLRFFDSLTELHNKYHSENRITFAEGACVYKTLLKDLANQKATTREPWQMTQREWNDAHWENRYISLGDSLSDAERVKRAKETVRLEYGIYLSGRAGEGVIHEQVVKKALSEGKPVPPEVLKDYPDLKASVSEQGKNPNWCPVCGADLDAQGHCPKGHIIGKSVVVKSPETIYLDKLTPLQQKIKDMTFPDYKGKHYRVRLAEKTIFGGTQWSGGSKTEYAIVDISQVEHGGLAKHVPEAPFLQRSGMHEEYTAIPPNFIVVEHEYVCGKDMGITFVLNPIAGTKFLPPKTELSQDEAIVLVATRSLKSSYAGTKEYRFVEANRVTGITRAQWEVAKRNLIKRGMLNEAGAITPSGKNAIGMTQLHELKKES
jgi:hypothetical protein